MRKERKIRKRKLNSKKILGLTSLILVGGLVTSCANAGLRKHHEYTRTEFTSDGEYKETRQFKPFDSNNNRDVENSFIYYGEWVETEDSKYQREVREYDIKGRTYEELKDVIYSSEKIEELLGKSDNTYIQITDYVSEEELNRGSYAEITIYTEDLDRVAYIKNNSKHNWLLAGSGLLIPGMIGIAIAWNKHNEAQEQKEAKKLTLKKEE